MALVTRTFTFTDGTTAFGSQVDSEVANLVNTFNNLDTAALTWDIVKAVNGSSTPLIADNSTGSNNVFEARVNGVAKVYVDGTGLSRSTNIESNLASANGLTSGGTATSVDNRIAQLISFKNLLTYRRPNLVYNSTTVVNIETGLDGTAGHCTILFPDGNLRTDTVTTRIQCNLAQNAVLSGTAQSGLRTGSAAANTWYSIYAVKVTDSSTNFVAVADTLFPIQANYSSLNSNFGTNGWVYLGTVANGDNAGHTTVILKFVQSGNKTAFYHHATGGGLDGVGPRLNFTAGATSLGWSYASGGSTVGQVPNNFTLGTFSFAAAASTKIQIDSLGAGGNLLFITALSSTAFEVKVPDYPLIDGVNMTPSGSTAMDIYLSNYTDGALGVGSNPIL